MKCQMYWKKLPVAARTAIPILGLIEFVLLFLAIRDIRRRPASQIRGPKWLWILISLIDFVGPIIYFKRGRVKENKTQGEPSAK